MIKNYFKTAFRNLQRNKGYASINILGLAVGIAACLLIFLVIRYETSFDNFHPKKKSIYRVASEFRNEGVIEHSGGAAFPTGPGLRIDFPQLELVASIFKSNKNQVIIENPETKEIKKFNEEGLYFVEPQFFQLFNFPWLAGNASTSLKDPNSIALTQETAERYFGDWHLAIGKTIKRNNEEIYKVTGIIKNVPANTDFPLDIVASYSSLSNTDDKNGLEDWLSTYGSAYTFVRLPDNYPVKQFNKELAAFAKRHKPADYEKDSYIAQPLSEMHFDEEYGNYRQKTFSRSVIIALTLIGIFLLVIACVNFINLATAQAVNRSKEVGVRKVLGSSRRQLAFQFVSETAVITIAAVFVAIGIAQAILPFLNQLLQVKISMNFFSNPLLILFMIVTTIVVTILSGLYPAIILSGFNPITALKTRITSKMGGGISLRRALVVLQFGIAHVLIIGTLIVVSQMDFFRKASLGFDRASMITVDIPRDSVSRTKMNFLRNQLIQNPGIAQVSFSYSSPSAVGNWNTVFKFDNSSKNTDFSANMKWADPEYFKTYGLHFVAGRPYYPSDTAREFVVNETLLKKLGITDPRQAIGKQLNFWDGKIVARIVGVIKDFNAYSLKEPMVPVVLSTLKEVYKTINIKIRPDQEKTTLAFIEKLWNETYPEYIYQYKFLDETIKSFYKQEDQLSQLYKIFAAIAIFISCLGLYGLVSFMAVQRTKEVGIRKVLGASARNIIYLLSKEFSMLIIIAFVIAGPVAWFIMHKWLQNYSYRIQMNASIFLLAMLGSMVIAWITVGHRAIKAALANPVKSLRAE